METTPKNVTTKVVNETSGTTTVVNITFESPDRITSTSAENLREEVKQKYNIFEAYRERKEEIRKSRCGGFLSDFSTKQKMMFVFLSLLLIGAVTAACVHIANKDDTTNNHPEMEITGKHIATESTTPKIDDTTNNHQEMEITDKDTTTESGMEISTSKIPKIELPPQERTINPDIESVTSMALDETGTFLYYSQCCQCVISRITINQEGKPDPQVVYSDTSKKCYNIAIVGDKLFFSFEGEDTTYRQQLGLDGKWEAVPWGSPLEDSSRSWRWAHSTTASIMQIRLGDSKTKDQVSFENGVFPIEFLTTSPVEPQILYAGFQGPTYSATGSKVVRYNIVTQEQEIILQDVSVQQAIVVQDFIIYITMGSSSPGNTGELYRKRLGSNERAVLVASGLASPDALCQTKDEILVNGLGSDSSARNQQAVVSFSTDSLLTTRRKIKPRVIKDGMQSSGLACTSSGNIFYSGYRKHKGIYETHTKINQ